MPSELPCEWQLLGEELESLQESLAQKGNIRPLKKKGPEPGDTPSLSCCGCRVSFVLFPQE